MKPEIRRMKIILILLMAISTYCHAQDPVKGAIDTLVHLPYNPIDNPLVLQGDTIVFRSTDWPDDSLSWTGDTIEYISTDLYSPYGTLTLHDLTNNINISFTINDTVFLLLKSNGDIYVKGRLVENDKEVVDALRAFLKRVE